MLELNDIIQKICPDLDNVNVARHTPYEAKFAKSIKFIASERLDLFNLFQATQGPSKEAMFSSRDYLASFLGGGSNEAIFVGLFRKLNEREIRKEAYGNIPGIIELRNFGMMGFGIEDPRETCIFYEFEHIGNLDHLRGKLVIDWSGNTRSWVRVAANNSFPIRLLSEENLFLPDIADWQSVSIPFAMLRELPSRWIDRLVQWRGIYLISDISDGRQYVGSAYGAENFHQRWQTYASSGHGGNKLLKPLNPTNFVFSILELCHPSAQMEEIIALENKWKDKLLTREFGLNDN